MAKFEPTEETSNWMKGSMGINITKTGLCEQIVNIWEKEMVTWPEDELRHLPELFQHAEGGKIFLQNQVGWTCRCKCPLGLCDKLLARIDGLRVNPRSKKTVWNPRAEPKLSKKKKMPELAVLPFRPKPNRMCYVCGNYTCIFERQRRGELVIGINSGHFYINTYLWKVANLFMMRGNERNETPNTGPADTDCALIFKMLKNCKLFHPGGKDDGEYDDLLEVRNFLMHTYDYRITTEALEECFERMDTVFRLDLFQDVNGRKAKTELSELKKKVIITTELVKTDVDFVREALADQHKALEQDFCISGNIALNPYILEDVLKVNNAMSTYFSPSANIAGAVRGAGVGASVGVGVGAFLGPPGAAVGGILGALIGGFIGKAFE